MISNQIILKLYQAPSKEKCFILETRQDSEPHECKTR